MYFSVPVLLLVHTHCTHWLEPPAVSISSRQSLLQLAAAFCIRQLRQSSYPFQNYSCRNIDHVVLFLHTRWHESTVVTILPQQQMAELYLKLFWTWFNLYIHPIRGNHTMWPREQKTWKLNWSTQLTLVHTRVLGDSWPVQMLTKDFLFDSEASKQHAPRWVGTRFLLDVFKCLFLVLAALILLEMRPSALWIQVQTQNQRYPRKSCQWEPLAEKKHRPDKECSSGPWHRIQSIQVHFEYEPFSWSFSATLFNRAGTPTSARYTLIQLCVLLSYYQNLLDSAQGLNHKWIVNSVFTQPQVKLTTSWI